MDIRSRVSIGEAVVAAVLAWLVLNAFIYIAAPLFGISVGSVARFFGSFLLPGRQTSVQIWVGRAILLAAFIGWGLLYRQVAEYIPGTGWLRGVLYGTGIWLVSGILLPIFGFLHPSGGGSVYHSLGLLVPFPGFWGVAFAGASGVALSVLAHQIFGAALGVMTVGMAKSGIR